MGMTAAFAMIGLGGGMTSGSQKASGRMNQALNNYNAELNELRATDAIERGYEAEGIHRVKTKLLIGSQRAAFGASNVEVNDAEGTPGNVYADTAYQSEKDALTIRANAAREAWGYRTGAIEDRYRGDIARFTGDSKATETLISAAGSALYLKYGFGSTTRGRK